jgi:hypothetical protein
MEAPCTEGKRAAAQNGHRQKTRSCANRASALLCRQMRPLSLAPRKAPGRKVRARSQKEKEPRGPMRNQWRLC